MKRFRSNFGDGARLALVALAVLFTLSFGNFAGTAAQAAPAIQPVQRPVAATHDGKGCTICAVMTVADTVFATPPLLMLPEAVEFLYRTTDAEFVHLKSAGVATEPRTNHAS
jgi:hypothetical protein